MVSNEEILATIKSKLEEKNEVIIEQQELVTTLQNQVNDLETKVSALEAAEAERSQLLAQINSLD